MGLADGEAWEREHGVEIAPTALLKFATHRFTGIRRSGETRVWNLVGWPQVFREMHTERMSAGRDYDGFQMLMMDGKVIMASEGNLNEVSERASEYCVENDRLVEQVRQEMFLKHAPLACRTPEEKNNG